MTELALTISRVWRGPKGGAVFLGKDPKGDFHKVVASEKVLSRPPRPEESWRVQGETETHPIWGLQIVASLAVPVVPEGEHLRRFLARNRAFQGVGEIRAGKLWEKFRNGLVDLLDAKDTKSLAEVVGAEIAETLAAAWEETRAEARVVEWLDMHGFPVRLAGKVIKLWGPLAPEKVEENPYRMLAVAGWSEVDTAARLMGVPSDADTRRVAAVEATCYRTISEKHTTIGEDELLRGVAQLLGEVRNGAESALKLACEDQAVVQLSMGRWQALGPHVMESYVQDRISSLVAAEFAPSGHLFWQVPTDAEVNALIGEFQAGNDFKLTDEQKQAVWLALTQRFALLLGGAGTGKTTVLKAVQWTVSRCEGTVHFLALAGRAAIRIQEATGHQARTIAGFLGALDRGDLALGGGDLIVIDEASMIDLPLMYTLLREIPEGTRVLLVGDPYQLPPIGMGLVFSVYAEDDRAPKVELTVVHRQAAETGIPKCAQEIRLGRMPELSRFCGVGKGVSFTPCTEADAQGLVIEMLSELGGPGVTQILSAIKRGQAGIQAINRSLHNLRSVGHEAWEGFAVGDPVIFLENDYERRIWNGTLGIVDGAYSNSFSVSWDGHSKPMIMERADLESLDLAYAVSVHKAQGSQFRRVVIPVFPSRLLDRTLIYTALTRAQEQVVLVGNRDALEAAVTAPPAPNRRRTGMGWSHDDACP
ncbi:AAA family ATPase [Mesoterricola silvestris]|uniref:ATP-dependent RecD-like DNA helicase n=1 Tax=Mesoterricola silvestris TaxID=2927979 RepID=A0AA48GN43_9BACT|nr:AAA family ATPase [Mesoterricola silvestris]BDU70862.1 ATP-dependent RecD-like DNA helicase [Mesoterricola silvestris]